MISAASHSRTCSGNIFTLWKRAPEIGWKLYKKKIDLLTDYNNDEYNKKIKKNFLSTDVRSPYIHPEQVISRGSRKFLGYFERHLALILISNFLIGDDLPSHVSLWRPMR